MPPTKQRASPLPWVKERRRYQNAMAQRRHRSKQRPCNLNKPLLHGNTYPSNSIGQTLLPPSSDAVASLPIALPCSLDNTNELLADEHTYAYPGWGSILQCLGSEPERVNVALIMAAANLGFRDIVKYGIVLLGSAIDEKSLECASHLSFSSWTRNISTILGDFDVKTVCIVGLRFLATIKGPSRYSPGLNSRENKDKIVPTIYGAVSMPYLTFASACVANAHYLRIPIQDLMDINAQSPFSRVIETGDSYDRESQDIFCTSLAPTWEQLMIPHHPFIDTLPWPSFRSQVIIRTHSEPPLIDQNELANDLIHNGIRCWGTSVGSLHGRGDGVPWDARSWEATPWFLDKWHSLLGDNTGYVA